MKNIRLISLLLALVLCLAVFVGCGDATTTDETTKAPNSSNEETTDSDLHPEITKKDYGAEFYLSIMTHVNQSNLYWVEESSNDVLTDAVFQRQEYLKEYLGVEMFAVDDNDSESYITRLQTAVKNKDDSVHLTLSHTFMGIEGFITGNYLTDFNDIDVIDINSDYWNEEFMEEVSINGHMYLGYSDFNIARTQVVAFNKDMYDKYDDAIGEEFYTIVNDYRWTLDKMISISNLVYIDATSDGKTTDDTFGLVSDFEVPYASLLQACDISVVDMNDKGQYVISVYTEENNIKTATLVDKLYDLVRTNGAYFSEDPTYQEPGKIFAADRALMHFARTTSLPGFLNDGINFGVLPYPMYDEGQKSVGYRSLQWGGYLCIPSYLSDEDMAFETVELLSYISDKVNVAYYEKLLGKQVADAPQDRKMLDIVWDSVCSDFGLTYSQVIDADFHYMMLHDLTSMSGSKDVASYVSGRITNANKKLSKFTSKIK